MKRMKKIFTATASVSTPGVCPSGIKRLRSSLKSTWSYPTLIKAK